MELWQDVRFAARLLVKDKWFTLVAVVALALGIGVNNTVFTVVNAILIRGLPAAEPERIMALSSYDRARKREAGVSWQDFKEWRDQTRSLVGLAAYSTATMNVSDEGRPPERFSGAFVSAGTFALVGQAPALGRDFLVEDHQPGAAAVVILSNGVWKSRYGSDPGVLGRVVRVNEVPSTVVGVMPEGFKFPQSADLWQPLAQVPELERQPRNARTLEAMGLLAPGSSRAEAQAELLAIGGRQAEQHPDTNRDVQPRVQPFNDRVVSSAGKALVLSLMGAVAFVLLIACANVANLLLARSAQRAREIALRVSLGATRWRIVRQLLVESVLLALLSGALGLALSLVGIPAFDAATQDLGKPYWMDFTLDGIVFVFLAAVCLGTGVVFGLAPALHMSRTDVNEVLKESGRSGSAGARAHRWTGGLIVAELALTLVLLAGAGFMMRSFLALYTLDLGVETSRLLTLRLTLPDKKYGTPEERTAFYERLTERLRANGRIQAASVASNLPLQGGTLMGLEVEARPLGAGEEPPSVTMVAIDPRYFETLGATLARGRGFSDQDGLPGHDSVIVNQRLAELHFPGEDPVGRRIRLSPERGAAAAAEQPAPVWVTVVGLAPTIRQRHVREPDPDPVAYVPFRTLPRGAMVLLARSQGPPGELTPLVREELRAVDPDLPLYGIQTMDQRLAQQRWPFEVFGWIFALFAAIALVLSAVGLYAMTAYSVTQRTQEIGVRMALGAQSGQVVWLFVRRSLLHLGIGLGLGVLGALGVGKALERLLVQTSARDPLTLLAIAALLAAVALPASLWPARRATRLDPLVALRHE